jgi:hypothetical protein
VLTFLHLTPKYIDDTSEHSRCPSKTEFINAGICSPPDSGTNGHKGFSALIFEAAIPSNKNPSQIFVDEMNIHPLTNGEVQKMTGWNIIVSGANIRARNCR